MTLKDASTQASDPFEALRKQGVAYVHFLLANPEHYRIVMMRGPSADEPTDDPTDEIASGAFGHLLDGVTAVVAFGLLEGDLLDRCLKLWAAAHGLASLLIAKPRFPWPPVEELVDETICIAGLGLAVSSRCPTASRSRTCASDWSPCALKPAPPGPRRPSG